VSVTQKKPCPIGVLLSGRGSNFAAIQNAITSGSLPNAEIKVVISNHKDAPGLAIARQNGIASITLNRDGYSNRKDFDTAICNALKSHQVKLVVLAGYDRILGEPVLSMFANRILNIHPSLLPAYGGKGMVGMKIHQAVLEQSETQSGCSVHLVTNDVDAGPILGQSTVPVLPADTPESLAERILAEEHKLYPQVIRTFIEKHQLAQGNAQDAKDALV
jgi:phosphoribosylglycinamide formyltransferase-1